MRENLILPKPVFILLGKIIKIGAGNDLFKNYNLLPLVLFHWENIILKLFFPVSLIKMGMGIN